MLLRSAHERKAAKIRPLLSFTDVFCWGLMGLWFGLVTTFDWQAIRTPIGLTTAKKPYYQAASKSCNRKEDSSDLTTFNNN
jgi:hypothetical protein